MLRDRPRSGYECVQPFPGQSRGKEFHFFELPERVEQAESLSAEGDVEGTFMTGAYTSSSRTANELIFPGV